MNKKFDKKDKKPEQTMYRLFVDFQPEKGEDGEQLTLTLGAAEARGYKLDKRFFIVSRIENVGNAYINYYYLVLQAMKIVHTEHSKYSGSRFLAMLGSGFIPVFVPPTFKDEGFAQIGQAVQATLEGKNIRHYFEGQVAIDSHRQCSTPGVMDIWASRIDLCEEQGIPLHSFDIIQYIMKEVLPAWIKLRQS